MSNARKFRPELASVLVVDDNPYHRAIVSNLLRSSGITKITSAGNGQEALEQMAFQKFDLIITDWVMSPLDGVDFTRKIRRDHTLQYREVPVIMLTSNNQRRHVEIAREAGITEYLMKPITAGSLISHITDVMTRPRRFVDSPEYVGPCRRRRKAEEYAGPMRRITDDPDDDILIGGSTEIQEKLNSIAMKVEAILPIIDMQDRARLRDIFRQIQEVKALALDAKDPFLVRAANAVERYVVGVGAGPSLDFALLKMMLLPALEFARNPEMSREDREATVARVEAGVTKMLLGGAA